MGIYIYSTISSGAFEIYINSDNKFSKLRAGRDIENYDIRAIFSEWNVKS